MDEAHRISEIAMLDGLLVQAGIYRTTKDFKALLDFTIELRNFAPFNAMLLQIQKPGLRFAASAADWRDRFRRTVKEDARPLIIMWPFCPIALVYDVDDTEGPELPRDVASAFKTHGNFDSAEIDKLIKLMAKKDINCNFVDIGDGLAGSIISTSKNLPKGQIQISYAIKLNLNHSAPVQFTTLVHELAHLYLGHLGLDKDLKVPFRSGISLAQQEIEAESVAYIVSNKNGLKSESAKYLSQFVDDKPLPPIHIYQIMRAAGQIEQLLCLGAKTTFDKPKVATQLSFAS
jgi:hypothetical protein